jgi:acylphosphatase
MAELAASEADSRMVFRRMGRCSLAKYHLDHVQPRKGTATEESARGAPKLVLATGRSLFRLVRHRLVIHGRVQGVFFRDTLRGLAEQHGVAGWARNTPEGTVETVLEGDRDTVEQVVQFARRGPEGAEVESVEITEELPEGLRGFSIR